MSKIYIVFVRIAAGTYIPVSARTSSVQATTDAYRLMEALCPDGLYYEEDVGILFKGTRTDGDINRRADVFHQTFIIDDEEKLKMICEHMKGWEK